MEFSFKPAIIRSVQTWQINNGVLTTPKQKQLTLSEVTKAHFIDMPYKGRWNAEFKLTTPTQSVSIICNDVKKGHQRQQFFLLIQALLDSLSIHHPTLLIRRGWGRIGNYSFAAIGLIPFGFGLSFIIDAIKRNFDSVGIGFGAFFILMGVLLIWSASPWQAPPTHTPIELKAALFPESAVFSRAAANESS